MREELNLPLDTRIFCFMEALFEEDLNLLISALKILKEIVHEMPKTILTGHHRIDKETCKELNIKLVDRLDTIEQVKKYLDASDFALIPVRKLIANLGRWPSKISDYFANKKPIITTPISDLKELFDNYDLCIISKSD